MNRALSPTTLQVPAVTGRPALPAGDTGFNLKFYNQVFHC